MIISSIDRSETVEIRRRVNRAAKRIKIDSRSGSVANLVGEEGDDEVRSDSDNDHTDACHISVRVPLPKLNLSETAVVDTA